MKFTIFATSLVTALSLSVRAGAAPAAPAPAPTMPPNQAVPVRPGSPLLPERTVGPGITATSTISSNPMAPSNQVGVATNELSMSNNVAAGNSNELNSNFLIRDQAVTASDRQLLMTLSQSVDAQLGITTPGASPVHFLIENGAVTLVGSVPTADASERITARVQQTPGVLSLFNDLHIGTPPTTVRPKRGLLGEEVGNHAFSPADRSLLTTVEQESAAQLGFSGASTTQMPVHFSIQNGVVGVTGQVASVQEKQGLLAAIQRTPGVVRVVDDVIVTGGANTTATAPTPFVPNGSLPATSMNQTNRVFLNPSNTSGF